MQNIYKIKCCCRGCSIIKLDTPTSKKKNGNRKEWRKLRKRIKALEKENKRLSEMNEFLEDAAAFFAASRQKSGKNKD